KSATYLPQNNAKNESSFEQDGVEIISETNSDGLAAFNDAMNQYDSTDVIEENATYTNTSSWSSFPKKNTISPKQIRGNNYPINTDWSSRDFEWTEEIERNLKEIFGLHSFREHQREAINATMAGKDTFV